jgi:membrane-associated phospholipid phosphatase
VCGYLPFNNLLKKGYHFKSAWDDKVPLIPWTVYPYLFLYMPWMIWFYASLYFQPLALVKQVTLATLICTTIAYFCFFFFPTYVVTEYPKGNSLAFKLLQFLFVVDKQFNACPSMHVFMSVLFILFSWQQYPQFGLLFLFAGSLIIISTVLTKRHYMYDIAGGILVGIVGYLGARYVI